MRLRTLTHPWHANKDTPLTHPPKACNRYSCDAPGPSSRFETSLVNFIPIKNLFNRECHQCASDSGQRKGLSWFALFGVTPVGGWSRAVPDKQRALFRCVFSVFTGLSVNSGVIRKILVSSNALEKIFNLILEKCMNWDTGRKFYRGGALFARLTCA